MNPNTFPTKGNLILAKNSLALATQGYGLMDKKRNILLRELMGLIDQAKAIQSEIDSTFTAAYKALQKANIEMGIHYVEEIAGSLPVTDDIRIKARGRPCGRYGAYQDPQHHGNGDPACRVYTVKR